jgi:uncharacterized protein YegJ (DUF2314 family)
MHHRSRLIVLLLAFLASVATAQDREQDRVVMVPDGDRDMQSAIAKAQSTLDEFLATWKAQPAGTSGYKLKVRVDDHGKSEHFWVTPFRQDGQGFVGILANEPQVVSNVKEGQTIHFDRQHISDWGYVRDGKQVGSFTVCALFKSMKAADVEYYRKKHGFTC